MSPLLFKTVAESMCVQRKLKLVLNWLFLEASRSAAARDSFFCLFAGRLFDFHVLDMIELGIEKYVSLSEIKVMPLMMQSAFGWSDHGPFWSSAMSATLQSVKFLFPVSGQQVPRRDQTNACVCRRSF